MLKEKINTKKSFLKEEESAGITLIALIITVIVLLILAGTAISIAINGGGSNPPSAGLTIPTGLEVGDTVTWTPSGTYTNWLANYYSDDDTKDVTLYAGAAATAASATTSTDWTDATTAKENYGTRKSAYTTYKIYPVIYGEEAGRRIDGSPTEEQGDATGIGLSQEATSGLDTNGFIPRVSNAGNNVTAETSIQPQNTYGDADYDRFGLFPVVSISSGVISGENGSYTFTPAS